MFGQGMRAGVTVENADDARGTSLRHHVASVVLRIAGVYDDGPALVSGEPNLSGKRRELRLARRVVVVVIQPAFADSDSAGTEVFPDERDVAAFIERGGVMRMDSSRAEHEPGMVRGNLARRAGGRERLPDADDRERARRAGARDYGVAVAGERRVREVGVAVDEDVRAPVFRGHLRSIQSSIGAAT